MTHGNVRYKEKAEVHAGLDTVKYFHFFMYKCKIAIIVLNNCAVMTFYHFVITLIVLKM